MKHILVGSALAEQLEIIKCPKLGLKLRLQILVCNDAFCNQLLLLFPYPQYSKKIYFCFNNAYIRAYRLLSLFWAIE
jgi:hypothetical protein